MAEVASQIEPDWRQALNLKKAVEDRITKDGAIRIGTAAALVASGNNIEPDWRQTLNLKKVVEDRITKDEAIGIGIAATAAVLVVGGLAAAE